jgi:hypothetical protein
MTYQGATEQSASVPRQQRFGEDDRGSSAWQGWVAFGGIIMILIGSFQVIEGFVALFKKDYFLVTKNNLLVATNFTAWGWTHIILGALVLIVGLGVLAGQLWARIVGIGLVMINAIVNLAFISAYPVWSTIIIAMDVIVIYALAVHGREMRDR